MAPQENVTEENTDVIDTQEESAEESNLLDMSDDELAGFSFDKISENPEEDEEPESEPEPESESEEESESESESEEEEESEESDKKEDEKDSEEEESNEEKKEDLDTKDDDPSKYKSIVDELFAPFKANGKDMKVDNINDAKTLMQMGANYNKKMAGLKPHLKVVKMLQNNGLMDETKLGFLIDLDKKDPQAIAKLIKESGINPLEIDVEKNEYTPKSYTVGDNEVELDSVLDDIRDTSTYHDTIKVVSNKWDDSSKRAVVANPSIIKIINEQMGNGIYAQVSEVMESERAMGRLAGMTDLEAYRYVGDALYQSGKMVGFEEKNTKPTENVEQVVDTKAKKEAERKDRKRAAAPTKAAPAKKAKPDDFDPLSLSDEEFEKISAKFL